MKKIKIAALIISSVVVTKAAAVAPLPMGWYLEVNGGGSKVTDASYVSGSSLTSSGIGWNVNGGYKFLPYFAGEVGYTQYASTSAKLAGNKVATATNYSYQGDGKALLPIGDTGFEFFAKLGIAHIHSNIKSTQFARNNGIPVSTGTNNVNGLFFGLGADYSFLPVAAVNVQWQRAKGNSKTGTLNLYSIGLSYLFG